MITLSICFLLLVNWVQSGVLHEAAAAGDLVAVQYHINKGELVNDNDYYYDRTPIHFAAENGHAEIVHFLVKHCNANVEAKDIDDMTPLHFAAKNGDAEIVHFLVKDCNANVEAKDARGRTPLHAAYSFEIIRVLVNKCNADIAAKNKDGKLALDFALERKNITGEEIKSLFKPYVHFHTAHDVSVAIRTRNWKLAQKCMKKSHVQNIKMLLEKKNKHTFYSL